MRNLLTTKWIVAIALLIALGLAASVRYRGGNDVQYITAKVERGDIHDEVEATGVINAVITVQVGSQVSGTIAKLNADFNSHVHRGDVIAIIDPALFQGALQQAEADFDNAKANVAAVEANLEKAKATLAQTDADYKRQSALVKSGAQSQQAAELSLANFEVAKSSVTAGEAAIAQAKAQVKQKGAAVAVARTNLEYTTIRSPIDGVVVARNVDVGQTVAASLQAPTIFNIAQDLTQMQLYAKTDESDVGRIKVGQTVTFKVDAFPKDLFHGVVSQKRMNATTVQNVVTYDTIIDFQNPELKLFPGMTAYVTIPVAAADNAVKIPNTALRFRPTAAELRRLYARYGIADSAQASAKSPAPARETGIVWKLRTDKSLEPVAIALGITDHAYTEIVQVIKGTLSAGDNVVTASVQGRGPGAPVGP
jgi:HlyD family secretion protein